MASSTTTLLQAVNRVLRDVGERQVTTISNPASIKAKDYLQEATRFVAASHDWEWIHNRVSASNWSGDTFTVTTAQQIRGVAWQTSTAFYDVQFVDVRQYDLQQLESFVSTTNTSTRPRYYTLPSYQTVRVNPYPTDATGQSKVVVYVVEDLQPPTSESAVFPVPEKYMQLVIKKADYYMAVHHLEDRVSAQFWDKDFLELLQRYRNQENKTPTGGFNMYRNRIRRNNTGIF